MDLRSGLRLLGDQWKLVLAVTLLTVIASGVLTSRQTPRYSSQMTLFVSAWGAAGDSASAYQASLLSQQKVKSYATLLRGHHVLALAISRLGLPTTPRELAKNVATAAVPETALLTVNVTDVSAVNAQAIANAIGEEFVALVPQLENAPSKDKAAVRVTIVDPAELVSTPVSPKPVRNLVVAGLLGLLIGCGLAAGRRILDTSIKSTEQLEESTGAPTLGSVPFDQSAAKQPLILSGDQYSMRGEAFRKIRTNLRFVDVDMPHKVVLVTSPVPGDGKSVTACNLAITLAEAGKKVLLIDGDLRRPRTATYLGLPAGVGLTSVLLGAVELPDAIQTWGDPSLSVLASGPVPPNPSELLGSQHMRDLVADLRGLFDVVVIDAAPTLPVTDAVATAAVCDGVVLVVRHGQTSQEQLQHTVTALRVAEVPILGTVLNMTPASRGPGYAYQYGRSPGDVAKPVLERAAS